jgi:hypothetical protein
MTDEGAVTRRGLLEAGALGAGGVLVLGMPDAAAAAAGARRVGSGLTDRHSVGLLTAIRQVGPELVGFGYLTRVRGLTAAQLFTSPPALRSTDARASDPGPARFTFYSQAKIESLAQLGEAISSTGGGSVRIYYQARGGATFADPGSFAKGVHIATLSGNFQNDLAITEPNTADVHVTADLTQTRVREVAAGAAGRVRFGGSGYAWTMRATGRGHRTDAAAPRSELTLAGDLGVVDAEPAR